MGYHPRIESSEVGFFLTTRSRNSEMWFIHNERLEEAILGYAAKFADRYKVRLYGLGLQGNHVHLTAHFPGENRYKFMRDLNSCVARAVHRLTPEYPGGSYWARRYSAEIVPEEDTIDQFFYTVLQPVQDGLVKDISRYEGYNCFEDAIYGREREFKVVRWGEYNAALRYDPSVPIEKFTDIVTLKYERIPGFEAMSQHEYVQFMREELRGRTALVVAERRAMGLGFLGEEKLREIPRGAKPLRTKTSDRHSDRPRVLSNCPERRARYSGWYFERYSAFQEASYRYRAGDLNTEFPPGMFRPPLMHRVGDIGGAF